jgi:hypothetical protein
MHANEATASFDEGARLLGLQTLSPRWLIYQTVVALYRLVRDGVLVSVGVGNTITSNSIFANAALGISLSNGGNSNLAAPSLLTAVLTGSTLTVTGSFTAPTANVSYLLQFFAAPSGDAEGKVYLGSLTVTPTTTGTQLFTFTTTTPVTGTYPLITATLTDNTADSSAFSSGVTTT